MDEPRPTFFASWQVLWDRVRPIRFGPTKTRHGLENRPPSLTLSSGDVDHLGDVLQDAATLPVCAAEHAAMSNLFRRADKAWQNTKDPEKRAKAVCRALGYLREDGKRRESYNRREVLIEFYRLRQQGLKRGEINRRLAAKFGFNSASAAAKYLERHKPS